MKSSTKKTGRRFNIIDVLIIVGIIIAVVFCINIVNNDLFAKKVHTVRYTVRIEGVDAGMDNVIKAGDKVYVGDLNIPAGVIHKVSSEKMKVTTRDIAAGRYATTEKEDLYTLILDIDAGCVVENGAYRTDELKISANTDIDINVPFMYLNSEIINVTDITDKEK